MTAFRLSLFLGSSGVGKSTLLSTWIDRARADGYVVGGLDPSDQWPDDEFLTWPENGHWTVPDPRAPGGKWRRLDAWLADFKPVYPLYDKRMKRFHTGAPRLLVLDDADLYAGSKAHGIWADLFSTFRHWGTHVILSARRTQGIPKEAVATASNAVIFEMHEPGAVDYVSKWLGPEVAAMVPNERFKAVHVDMHAHTVKTIRTRKRAVTTRADMLS